jgi:catechol 2,3-dioxygenase-like lactoylglutathione lyase family enzyme
MAEGQIGGIHHIGVTVNDASHTVDVWARAFGAEGKVVDIPENEMKIGVVHLAGVTFFFNEYTSEARRNAAIKGVKAPVTYSGHRIVNRYGEGISHIALETKDLADQLDHARAVGLNILYEENKDALEGVCNFISPEDVGLPLEFMQAVKARKNPLA